MSHTRPLRGPAPALRKGLYLITPDASEPERLLARVRPLLPLAACVQLRCKSMDAARLRVAGTQLRQACRDAGVPLIVNDDPRLAADLDADGVHLGEHDGGIAQARAVLGAGKLVGASCYDSLARARDAVARGADYVAFGAFFPSPTKPHAARADAGLLRDAAGLGVPRVAIGGITPDNARPLVAAGADLVAVISGVFDAADPLRAARAYLSCFDEPAP